MGPQAWPFHTLTVIQAEGLDLKASPSCAAEAVVVEAKLDKGQGPVATAIVKRGSLEVGQYVVVGCHWGKVRSLRTATGNIIKKALPGQPVEIAGLKGVPHAGDHLQVLPRYARHHLQMPPLCFALPLHRVCSQDWPDQLFEH